MYNDELFNTMLNDTQEVQADGPAPLQVKQLTSQGLQVLSTLSI